LVRQSTRAWRRSGGRWSTSDATIPATRAAVSVGSQPGGKTPHASNARRVPAVAVSSDALRAVALERRGHDASAGRQLVRDRASAGRQR
jgi:hypothetical protein